MKSFSWMRQSLVWLIAVMMLTPSLTSLSFAQDDPVVDNEVVDTVEDALVDLAEDDEITDEDLEDVLEDVLDEIEDLEMDDLNATLDEVDATIDAAVEALGDTPDSKRSRALRALKFRLRAEALRRAKMRHESDDDSRSNRGGNGEADGNRGLWEIRWGVLDADRRNCARGTDEEVLAALEAGDELPGCESERVEYSGKLSVDRGSLRVRKEVLFEKNDEVLNRQGDSIVFDSVINGHWDGLIVQYTPDENRSPDNEAMLDHSFLVATNAVTDSDANQLEEEADTLEDEVNELEDQLDDLESLDAPTREQQEKMQQVRTLLRRRTERLDAVRTKLNQRSSTVKELRIRTNFNTDTSVDFRSRLEMKRQENMNDKDRPVIDREPVMLTLSLGTLTTTLPASEVVGRHDIGNGHFVEIKPLVNVGEGVSDANRERMIENKVRVQDKVSDVEEKVNRLRQLNRGQRSILDLESVIDEIGAYNFDSTSAAEIEAELQAALADLGDDATDVDIARLTASLQSKATVVKRQAVNRKFQQNLIPFKDTDDDQWFTRYVSGVKARGIISGYKDSNGNDLGEYRPGNDVTVAEIFKIGLETAGEGQANVSAEGPRARVAQNHWARLYVKKAEDLGLDLSDQLDDLNRPATRGEVIRLMLEALGIDPGACTTVDFTDVDARHPHACFIQYAKELGIISGDDGRGTFRPNEPINRAETAKIADEVLGTLVEE